MISIHSNVVFRFSKIPINWSHIYHVFILQTYHSNAGCSRSVSIALCYVLYNDDVDLNTALERLRKTRPSARPNNGFMIQLRELEQSLKVFGRKDGNQ